MRRHASAALQLVFTHRKPYEDRHCLPRAVSRRVRQLEQATDHRRLLGWHLLHQQLTRKGHNAPHRNEFGLMADFRLSKRTDVHVKTVYQKASVQGVLDEIGDLSESSSHYEIVARAGTRTSF
jgi:hypothetical protein